MSQPWYKDAIIYSLDVRRFFDSDGDGVGDFAGVAAKLDYLSELGVTCLWLLPSHPSPERDGGYDVADYMAIDPRLGGLEGLTDLVRQAGERGIRVVLDLVVNHTSDQHPWFQAARRNPHSRYHAYYIWAKHPPPPREDAGPMFPGEQTSVWTYDECAGAYYFHRFYAFEPELNFATPGVAGEVERIIDFWMSMGVAGFRLDSASHLTENGDEREPHPANAQALLRRLYATARAQDPQAAMMAEVNEDAGDLEQFLEGGDQVSLLLNFYMTNFLFLALARGSAEPVLKAAYRMPQPPDTCAWANFLRNHDELNLQRLNCDEREEVMAAFAPQPDMTAFDRGARRRLAPMLGDPARLKLAWSMVFSLPGAPVIYYGDEIGMGEDLTAEGRLAVRTPMQWTKGRNGGFSSAPANKLIQPVVTDAKYAPPRVNVEAQQADPDSLFHWMRRLTRLRRNHSEVMAGRLDWLDSGTDAVLAHRFRTGRQTLLLAHNLTNRAVTAKPELGAAREGVFHDLLSDEPATPEDGSQIRLAPYGCRWLLSETTG